MAKKGNAGSAKAASVHAVEERAAKVADALALELVEVVLQKESRGKCLCVYVDKEGGLSLDDCERFHKQLQPLVEDVDYDFLEVSSPGLDRPIKTLRDFEKNRDALVEVKLFAPQEGSKLHQGYLRMMDDASVTIETADQRSLSFERKAVAIIKPVIILEDEDFSEDATLDDSTFSDMEFE
ncbi:MAG: ribosome maturation factor RimP [Clostridiales bacterium]|nr:ribosome maturation factor RimP [Clostridiales bacterium]